MIGVNLAGAEFGYGRGIYGIDYIYPSIQDLGLYAARGVELVRLPFTWERMQSVLGGELNSAELGRMTSFLDEAHQLGIQVVLDLHNYGRYDGATIGSAAVPTADFADFWMLLASELKDHPAVYGYGLMNEPHDMGNATIWPMAAQAAVNAIRTVDAGTTVIVAGDEWSGAADWATKNANLRIQDPADNVLYEAHIYFDRANQGIYSDSFVASGVDRTTGVKLLQPFLDWLAANDARGFIGEFAVPSDDPRWLPVLDTFVGAMAQSGLSGTYWAGGPWWGADRFAVQPIDGQDRPQMAVLQRHMNEAPMAVRKTGGPDADVLAGGRLADTLSGGASNDALFGLDGKDQLWGGSGDDSLHGGTGDDVLNGDDGADEVRGGSGADLIEGGAGNDSLWGDDGDDVMGGQGGDDTLQGGSGQDRVYGDDGDDVLGGQGGNDYLDGQAGADRLWGDEGNDTLLGGGGSDVLEGGAGDDRLRGQGEADTFVFGQHSGCDTILDFEPLNGDRLSLQGQGFSIQDTAHGMALALSGGGTVLIDGLEPREFSSGWLE